jgi:hypothetical protein
VSRAAANVSAVAEEIELKVSRTGGLAMTLTWSGGAGPYDVWIDPSRDEGRYESDVDDTTLTVATEPDPGVLLRGLGIGRVDERQGVCLDVELILWPGLDRRVRGYGCGRANLGQPRPTPGGLLRRRRPPSLTCLFSVLCRARRHSPQVPGLGLLQLVGVSSAGDWLSQTFEGGRPVPA